MEPKDIWAFASSLLCAFLGGIASYLKESERFKLYDFIRRSFISVFTGTIVYLLCFNFTVAPALTGALTGLSGYAGTQALDFLWEAIKNKVVQTNITKQDISGQKEE